MTTSQSLSPLDGRYRKAVAPLTEYLSEAGLNRARLHVEVEWLIALTEERTFGATPLPDSIQAALRSLVDRFGDAEIEALAAIEATTNHDVKAVEIFLRGRLEALGAADRSELIHFGCTSEDINNLAYAITIKAAIEEVWSPRLEQVLDTIQAMADEYRDVPMLAHTHGQPATPTTLGKELGVTAARIRRQLDRVDHQEYLGKFNGATGTYAAVAVAGPDIDWRERNEAFVESLGLTWNPLTTQIESHDWQAELYSKVILTNVILHNFCTDMWTYISMGYFHQNPVAGEVGSSTMPHKVNPIRFENAEANLELANALLTSLSQTLPTSRMQRDLTDSTSQRNIGVALGHSVLAADNLTRGLASVTADAAVLAADLDHNWEVLAEAIQTVIRAEVIAGRSTIEDPYTVLKEFTRGHRVTQEDMVDFVTGLDIGSSAKRRLLKLTPATYIGYATKLVP